MQVLVAQGKRANGVVRAICLAHYGLVNLVHIGSSNGLLPYDTKPLSEPISTYHQWELVVFIEGNVTGNEKKLSILDSSLKITNLNLQLCLPGASELIPLQGYHIIAYHVNSIMTSPHIVSHQND